MTNLKSLKINSKMEEHVSNNYPAINKIYLNPFVRISELNTWDDDYEEGNFPENRFGRNYEIIDNMKELKLAKLQKRKYLDCAKIQAKYPEVRFQWCQKRPFQPTPTYSIFGYAYDERKCFNHLDVDHFYEGEFSSGSTYGGKGVVIFPNGDRYEGELFNNAYHNYGVYTFANGIRCECMWKNGGMDGKGVFFDANGIRLAGNQKYVEQAINYIKRPRTDASKPVLRHYPQATFF